MLQREGYSDGTAIGGSASGSRVARANGCNGTNLATACRDAFA